MSKLSDAMSQIISSPQPFILFLANSEEEVYTKFEKMTKEKSAGSGTLVLPFPSPLHQEGERGESNISNPRVLSDMGLAIRMMMMTQKVVVLVLGSRGFEMLLSPLPLLRLLLLSSTSKRKRNAMSDR